MNRFKLLLPLVPLLTLSACAMIPPGATSPRIPPPPLTPIPTTVSGTSAPLLCSELQIVQLSRLDTDETKLQVAMNNHVITALCGKS